VIGVRIRVGRRCHATLPPGHELTEGRTMTAQSYEIDAMRRALELAAEPGVQFRGNPRVGAVILSSSGEIIGQGSHRGAGSPHAEVSALADANQSTVGATAVVTLEPCAHTGRTGPCAEALISAGISRVVFAQADPNPVATGGAQRLREAGIAVVEGVLAQEALKLNEVWTFAVTHQRPYVTWKVATTLDGRIAAADGSSRWITGEQARADVHEFRRAVDAVLVGHGTVIADDPHLTVRLDGQVLERELQPLRVVMSESELDKDLRIFDDAAQTLWLRTHSVDDALAALHERGVRHVMLEGGATLAAAFLEARAVNAVRWYVAPAILGAGRYAIEDFGAQSIADVLRLTDVRTSPIGSDICVTGLISTEVSKGSREIH